jgi:hypothetical protein
MRAAACCCSTCAVGVRWEVSAWPALIAGGKGPGPCSGSGRGDCLSWQDRPSAARHRSLSTRASGGWCGQRPAIALDGRRLGQPPGYRFARNASVTVALRETPPCRPERGFGVGRQRARWGRNAGACGVAFVAPSPGTSAGGSYGTSCGVGCKPGRLQRRRPQGVPLATRKWTVPGRDRLGPELDHRS